MVNITLNDIAISLIQFVPFFRLLLVIKNLLCATWAIRMDIFCFLHFFFSDQLTFFESYCVVDFPFVFWPHWPQWHSAVVVRVIGPVANKHNNFFLLPYVYTTFQCIEEKCTVKPFTFRWTLYGFWRFSFLFQEHQTLLYGNYFPFENK